MNRSEIYRLINRALFLTLFILVLPIPLTVKKVFISLWVLLFLLFHYGSVLSLAAFLSYQKRGKDRYLKLMLPAYKSGRLNPKSAATLSYILLRDGELEKASEVLDYAELAAFEQKKWRNGEAKYNHVHSYRALILWKQDRLNDAAMLLTTLLDQGYKTSNLYANLGWFLIKQGKYPQALELNLEALEYDRSNAMLDNVGHCYLLMGNLEKSREIYEELIDNKPDFPDAWYNFGALLEKEGHSSDAQQMYQRALACNFSFLGTITKEEIEQAVKP
jgi:tetratricopeptide (TPR) repeat protein